MEIHTKLQKWISSVLDDKLENVVNEVKDLRAWILDSKSNRLIFKTLICLAHTADRTEPLKTRIGIEIFKITDSLCYSLIEIPDQLKYFSSLFHIIRKLIAMRLYSEAMTVTVWSFPGNLICDLTQQQLDIHSKIASLWREAANRLIRSSNDNLTAADYKTLLILVKNEFKVLEVIAKKRLAYALCRILLYLTQLEAVPVAPECKAIQSYRKIAKHFLAQIDVPSTVEEKYEIYQEVLRFVNSATVATYSKSTIENTVTAFTESCSLMETIVATDVELDRSFLIYRKMGLMLLNATRKSRDLSHGDLHQIEEQTLHLIHRFRHGKGASLNMRMIGFILQSLITQWESCIISADSGFLNAEMLRDILGLIMIMFSVPNSTWSANCGACHDKSCRLKKNIHAVTVICTKCLIMLSKLPAGDLFKDIFPSIKEVLEENVSAIFDMRESGCPKWLDLWANCGVNIYNLGAACHKAFYEECIYFFSLLCSCIIKFNGLDLMKKTLGLKDPLAFILHKLSGLHLHHGNYREASTPCALNGLLSYADPNSKAFYTWAEIKHYSTNSTDASNMTMLSCLREDMDVISELGMEVKLEDYDLIKLCLRELRSLNDARSNLTMDMCAVLNELTALNCGALEYAQGVHLLGYHCMNHRCNGMMEDTFRDYLTRAIRKLEKERGQSNLHRIVRANIAFYNFFVNQSTSVDVTQNEMKLGNFGLATLKKNAEDFVPFTKINVRQEFEIFSELERALNQWSSSIAENAIARDDEWYWSLTLRILMVAGEYTRLHKISHLETKAWSLAYKIACQLNDVRTRLHVVGRSISLRNMNSEWIEDTKELLAELEASDEPEDQKILGFFLINLSNFYYEISKHEEAGKTLQKASAIPVVNPLKGIVPYLSSVDTIVRNHYFYSTVNKTTTFMAYIVHCLYAMIALSDTPPLLRSGAKVKYLCGIETLLRCTANMSLRMNSIFSFKEISSHLTIRLKFSQTWGLTLCAAECLKNLCLIDLSRMKLENCLVKLQSLEYILQVDSLKKSQSKKSPTIYTNQFNNPGCRDPQVKDESPVLRKELYKQPDFVTHEHSCLCYKCKNIQYQYLVLSSLHIRAKLYFFEGWKNEALGYFSGAFSLQRKLFQDNSRKNIEGKKIPGHAKVKPQPWNCSYNAVEYALLLIDFSRCIRELITDNNQAEINIAVAALNICEKYQLWAHPIYVSAKELVLEYQFCNLFPERTAFDKFTVPDPSEIDISKFIYGENKTDYSTVSTPALKPCIEKPKTMKRVKTPPLLQLTKVSLNLSDDEEEFESPKSSRYRPKSSRVYAMQKPLMKKNLEKYLDTAPEPCGEKTDAACKPENAGINELEKIVTKVESMAGSMFPNLSRQLSEIIDEAESNNLEKISRAIKLVEELEGRSKSAINSSEFGRLRNRKNSSEKFPSSQKDQANVVDELVTCFKEMLIKTKDEFEIISTNGFASQSHGQGLASLPPLTNDNLISDFGTKKEDSSTIVLSDDDSFNLDEKLSIKTESLIKSKTISHCTDSEEIKLEKPKSNGYEQRLKTSTRIKTSLTRTEKTDQTKPAGDSDPDLSPNEAIERKTERRKRGSQKEKLRKSTRKKSEALQGGANPDSPSDFGEVEKSKSTCVLNAAVFKVGETSQLNDSDFVISSDIEEISAREKIENGLLEQLKVPLSSRILRSRSRTNGTTTNTRNVNNSNRSQISDSEKLADEKNEGKNRSKVSSRVKKSVKNSNIPFVSSDSPGNQENQEKPNKRPTSGRVKRHK